MIQRSKKNRPTHIAHHCIVVDNMSKNISNLIDFFSIFFSNFRSFLTCFRSFSTIFLLKYKCSIRMERLRENSFPICHLSNLICFHATARCLRMVIMNDKNPVDFRAQFHQHSTHSFYVSKLGAQLFCAYILGLYFTGARLLAQKLHLESWWNWLQEGHSNNTWHFPFILLFYEIDF